MAPTVHPSRLLPHVAALALAAVLIGCGDGQTDPSVPEAPVTDQAPPPITPPVGDVRLADAVTGTFDQTAEACAEPGTMTRLTVSQDTLAFYYGYATVDQVTPRDGGYDVSATLYQQEGAVEVVPEPVTYQIETQEPGDGIVFGSTLAGQEPSPLVRCDRP